MGNIRLFVFILVILFTLSLVQFPAVASPPISSEEIILIDETVQLQAYIAADVIPSHWAYIAMSFVLNKEWMQPIGLYFYPYSNGTRGASVFGLGRILGVKVMPNSETGYTNWALSTGVSNGTGSGGFDPNLSVTRQDFCTFVGRYCEIYGIPMNSTALTFLDKSLIAGYAYAYIQ